MSYAKNTGGLRVVVLAFLLAFMPASVAEAQETMTESAGVESLLDLPLEQLAEIAVAGTLTETDPRRTPARVTTITARDIAVTPARNLLDLIEIYVPGAIWLTHSAGPTLGMRGIIADRNYKYLVLVNGIVVNNSLYYGALSELSMWDLTDIEKVEVIRGPGSVTYGPGAIGGVINITLKSAKTAPGTELSAFYWDKYIARGASIGHGYLSKDGGPNVYGFFSYVDVLGVDPDNFNVFHSGRSEQALGYAGYLGTNPQVLGGRPAADYLGSFFGEPSIKAYVDVDFNNGWRFWSRYTTDLIPTNTSTDTKFIIDGELENFRLMRNRQYLATLEKTHKLNEDWGLVATFNFTSTELKNVGRFVTGLGSLNDQDNLRNITQWATENRWFNRLQFNYDPEDTWKAAIGAEFTYKVIGP
ncbi:MAG TPA: TonB-dependent receptor, partial [Sedimentisphaerales bacterium]|nr:TonB-dependent receptor [Sedimentisphaerales bacterium]